MDRKKGSLVTWYFQESFFYIKKSYSGHSKMFLGKGERLFIFLITPEEFFYPLSPPLGCSCSLENLGRARGSFIGRRHHRWEGLTHSQAEVK